MSIARRNVLKAAGMCLLPLAMPSALAQGSAVFNVRDYGAKGDGNTVDTTALQRTIDAAAAAGGGVVYLPAGRFVSFSIHLHSNITLQFSPGSVLVAADPRKHSGSYDLAEPNPWDAYQDYGHSYFHNSLIWGENIQNVAILGNGLIDGAALVTGSAHAPWSLGIGRNLPPDEARQKQLENHRVNIEKLRGQGNKAIALKNVRNVTLRDFSILRGGHIGILATGVDTITMDNLLIDSNRDGIDLDCVRNARLSNLSLNTPRDDAIVLKSSFALGEMRPTENITITNCFVSGYDIGTLWDGTRRKSILATLEQKRVCGRIKLGTESNGGYRNIAISNCVFDCCSGLALETVDGGVLEDVVVSNLVMRDLNLPPIFIYIGDRRRAPPGAPVSSLRRVLIHNIDASVANPRYASIIAGQPNAPVEDVSLENIRIHCPGGGTVEDANRKADAPADAYPEPNMFDITQAWGLYMRHVSNIRLKDVAFSLAHSDARPVAVVENAVGIKSENITQSMPERPVPRTVRL